jgi:multidrug transporter EmrE-like cation transporter
MAGHKLKPQVLVNLSASIFMGVFAQLLMKYGMNKLRKIVRLSPHHSHQSNSHIYVALFKTAKVLFIIFSDKFVITGVVLYLISMFFWIKVLSKIDLSVAYPFVSIGIVLTVILAAVTLGEPVPLFRWVGIFITLCGVYVIVSSHKETRENKKNCVKK